MSERAAFEVCVGDKVFRVWADGRTEGFVESDKPCIVINLIPQMLALAAATAAERQTEVLHGQG